MDSNSKGTPISELGEFGLIRRLTENTKIHHKESFLGVGDDAAVVKNGEKYTVVSTDMLMEGIHFNLVYFPLKHLGYKAITTNLADVYAMNAKPKQVTFSIAVSNKFSVEMLDDLYEGIHSACKTYEVDLIGGDTTSSLTGLAISVTIIGEAEEGKLTLRSKAKPTDLVCVSGTIGAAYMGLQLLEREHKVFKQDSSMQPDLSGHEYLLGRQLKPEVPRHIIDLFKEKNIQPNAMIDLSDGLASDLNQICEASEVGCKVFYNKIPIDQETKDLAEEMHIEPLICALNGGDDYELLFTLPLEEYETIKEETDFTVIGHITEKDEGNNLITSDGRSVPLGVMK